VGSLSVSVIITTFNRAHLVTRAVESALAQVELGDEIIVVDDGSADGTVRVLEPFADRIRYISQPNAGQAAALNHGISEARGDLVAFLDDDDEWLPGKLTLQRKVMEALPQTIYTFSSFTRKSAGGSERTGCLTSAGDVFEDWKRKNGPGTPFSSLGDLPPDTEDFAVITGDVYPAHLRADFMFGGVLLVRRRTLGPRLQFSSDLSYCMDWEFYSRLSRLGPAAYLDIDLYRWYEHDGVRMADQSLLQKATARLEILQRVWGDDEDFLEDHAELVERRVDEERVLRLREFIVLGQMKDARRELGSIAGEVPPSLRLLARLPSWLVGALLATRRGAKRVLGSRN